MRKAKAVFDNKLSLLSPDFSWELKEGFYNRSTSYFYPLYMNNKAMQWKPVVFGIIGGVLVSFIIALITNMKGGLDGAADEIIAGGDMAAIVAKAENLLIGTILAGAAVGSLIIAIGYRAKLHFIVTLVGAIITTGACGIAMRSYLGLPNGSQQFMAFLIIGLIVGIIAWVIGMLAHKFGAKKA